MPYLDRPQSLSCCVQEVQWRASSYMEVDEAMGGAMQKGVKCDLEMLKLCTPLLRMCDDVFSKWYTELHGEGSIHKLKRLQVCQ